MDNFKAILIGLIVCAVISQVVADSQQKDDSNLAAHIDSEDIETNFVAAEELYVELKSKIHIFGTERVELLKKITLLRIAMSQCTDESFKQFEDVLKDLHQQPPDTSDLFDTIAKRMDWTPRVLKFVSDAAAKHAKDCQDKQS